MQKISIAFLRFSIISIFFEIIVCFQIYTKKKPSNQVQTPNLKASK